MKLSDRRSAIELSGTNERLKAMGGHWKWCNISQQLAGGLTKASARALCLEAFARGVVSLKFDEAMVAAKKVKPETKQAEVEDLEQAARHFVTDQGLYLHDVTAEKLNWSLLFAADSKVATHQFITLSLASGSALDDTTTRACATTPSELEQCWRQQCWRASLRPPRASATLMRSRCWWLTTAGSLPS